MKLMSIITARLKLPVVTLFFALVAFPAAAAIDGTKSSAVQQLGKICSADVAPVKGDLRIFTVGVKCFESMINGLAEDTIIGFSEYLRDIVYMILILYIIIYGARVALGFSSPDKYKSEFYVSALKIAFVTWLVFSFGLLDIYQLVLGTYHSMLEIVIANANFGECTGAAMAGSLLGSGTEAIWATMDCQFSKFIGWEANNGRGVPHTGIPLLFGLISTKILPANGLVIGGLLFTVLMTLMMSFFRLAFVYILSMMAIILLFSISPIMIPLMLFNQTKSYFEGWYKVIISMILQPVILFAFYSFIAVLLAETVQKFTDLMKELKPAFELVTVDKLGTLNSPQQSLNFVSDITKNIDPELILSGITTLVVAYLLMSFINFVASMAKELAGTATAPDLSGMTPSFAR